MKFEKGGSMGAGLNVARFAAKLRARKKNLAPAEEEAAPSMAGGMMALRFAAKAKHRVAQARELRRKEGHNKREVVSVDKQVALVKSSLGQLDARTDVHTIVSAFNAAKYLAQKHSDEVGADVSTAAQEMEQRLRQENPQLAMKMDLRNAPKIKSMIRRMWDLLLVESVWLIKLKAVLQRQSDEVIQKEGWKALFELMDQDGGGTLDVEEFTAAVRKSGVEAKDISDADLQATFQAVDDDGSGEVDGDEFAAWLVKLDKEAERARTKGKALSEKKKAQLECMDAIRDASEEFVAVLGWQKLFEKFDDDGSGGLDAQEFTEVVRSCRISTKEASDEDLLEVFKMIDDDDSGAISATELAEALCKDSPKRLGPSSTYTAPEVTLTAYTRYHCALGKALSEKGADWSREEAEDAALVDWTEDVARFSSDATINSWFIKVKQVLQSKSEEVVQKEGWAALFRQMDQDGNGALDVTEFTEAVRKSGVGPNDISNYDLKRTFEAVDADGGGEIDGEELAAWLMALTREEERAEARGKALPKSKQALIRCMNAIKEASSQQVSKYGWKKLFEKFDEDGSGGLDCAEFTAAVRAESGLTTDDVSDSDMREVFGMIDDDGSGVISAEEFAECLCTDDSENYKMTYEAFERSMFELVDYWASGVSEAHYTAFFGSLFRSIVIKMTGVDSYDKPVLKTAIRDGGESNFILKEAEDVEPIVDEDGKLDLGEYTPPEPEPEPEPEAASKKVRAKTKAVKSPRADPNVDRNRLGGAAASFKNGRAGLGAGDTSSGRENEDNDGNSGRENEDNDGNSGLEVGNSGTMAPPSVVGHFDSAPMQDAGQWLPKLGSVHAKPPSSAPGRYRGARGGGFRDEEYSRMTKYNSARAESRQKGVYDGPCTY
eukprot:COSAG02_NODE_155_length_33066_cov_32.167562_2_plen_889_part_00